MHEMEVGGDYWYTHWWILVLVESDVSRNWSNASM